MVAGESLQVAADGYAGSAGISTAVPVAALRESASIPFRMKLTLAGSSQLTFLPLARKADITLKSDVAASEVRRCAGAARPEDQRGRLQRALVGARDQPQLRPELVRQPGAARASRWRWPSRKAASGVTFYEPVDIYQRNYRAVHYAVLLIVITFLTFFLWEHLSGIAIHGMQYLMVGLALALFYLLLLALSEHMSFDLAYGAVGRRAGGADHRLPDRRAQAR